MTRLLALLILAATLAGCTMPKLPALPAPAPTPDAEALFWARYAVLDAPYDAMIAQINAPDWADPAWRDELARRADVWREAVEALRTMEQPTGERWADAWPTIRAALDEYAYAAGAVESAATANDPALMGPVKDRLIDGVNLMHEAMRLLEDK